MTRLDERDASTSASLRFARRLDRMTQTIALTGFCGLVAVALLTFYDGAARYLSVPRLSGFNDYGELVYPIVIASCFPAGLLRQSNVTIRIAEKLAGGRIAMVLEALAALVTLVFFSLLVWQFVQLTQNYAGAARTTRTVEMLLAPWWWVTTAIVAVCVPVQAYVTWSWMGAAISGRTPVLTLLKSRHPVDSF